MHGATYLRCRRGGRGQGFTMVELLVTVAVVGILAAFCIVFAAVAALAHTRLNFQRR